MYLKRYIDQRIDEGIYPSIKQIADLRICKSNHVGYEGVKTIVENLDYNLYNTDLPLGQQLVVS